MMDLEKIIDEIAARLHRGRDISFWQNSPQISPIANLLSKLSSFPKSKIPVADFTRIKNQVLDRIAIPAEITTTKERGFFALLPSVIKFAGVAIGSLLIVVSLGIGTSVAALNSMPGQPMYPLKKVVENIELKLTRDPAARANLQIQFANTRLDELSAVIEKNLSGEISNDQAQQIVSETVSDLQKTAAAVLNSSTKESTPTSKQVSTLNKLVSLSNKQAEVLKPLLSAANISSDGQVKIAVEQALQASQISKEEAIKNIENAGLKVEDQPFNITEDTTNKISADGKITSLTSDSITIGTAKFLMTKDTEYVNIKSADLKVDLAVKITGEVKSDKKTYALTITAKDSTDTNTDSKNSTEKPTDPEDKPTTTETP
jgi:hypothetical protein